LKNWKTNQMKDNSCQVEAFVIPKGKYKTILIDPPWKYGKWGKASEKAFLVSGINEETNKELPIPYKTMTVEKIKLLPLICLGKREKPSE